MEIFVLIIVGILLSPIVIAALVGTIGVLIGAAAILLTLVRAVVAALR